MQYTFLPQVSHITIQIVDDGNQKMQQKAKKQVAELNWNLSNVHTV